MIPPAGIAPGKENLFYNESHHAWREELKKFVAKEIAPFVEEWEEAGEFPRELYKKAAAIGLMGMGYDEKYGGTKEGIDILTLSVGYDADNYGGGIVYQSSDSICTLVGSHATQLCNDYGRRVPCLCRIIDPRIHR